jgi:hypothetical protein
MYQPSSGCSNPPAEACRAATHLKVAIDFDPDRFHLCNSHKPAHSSHRSAWLAPSVESRADPDQFLVLWERSISRKEDFRSRFVCLVRRNRDSLPPLLFARNSEITKARPVADVEVKLRVLVAAISIVNDHHIAIWDPWLRRQGRAPIVWPSRTAFG